MARKKKNRNKNKKHKESLLLQYVPKALSNLILSYAYQFRGKVKSRFLDVHDAEWTWGLSTCANEVLMHHDDNETTQKTYNMLNDTYYDINWKENEIYLDRHSKLVGCHAVKCNCAGPVFLPTIVQMIGGCIYLETLELKLCLGTYNAVVILHSWLCLCLADEYVCVYDLQKNEILWTDEIVLTAMEITCIVQHGFIYQKSYNSFVMCIVDRIHTHFICFSEKLDPREIQRGLYASNGVFCACSVLDDLGAIIWSHLTHSTITSAKFYICYRNKYQYYLSKKPSPAKMYIKHIMMLQDGLLYVSCQRIEQEFTKNIFLLVDLEAMQIIPFPTFLQNSDGFVVTTHENRILFQDGNQMFVLE